MKELKFKTTINCASCVAKVTPLLDKEDGISSWEVDLNHADRVLTVLSGSLTGDDVSKVLLKIGFKAEEI